MKNEGGGGFSESEGFFFPAGFSFIRSCLRLIGGGRIVFGGGMETMIGASLG